MKDGAEKNLRLCEIEGDLGLADFSQSRYDSALAHFRQQLAYSDRLGLDTRKQGKIWAYIHASAQNAGDNRWTSISSERLQALNREPAN